MRYKIGQLEAFLADKKVDVLCVTEHWLNEEEIKRIRIGDFKCIGFYARKEYIGGGTAIFTKSEVEATPIESIKTYNIEKCIETCAIFIKQFNLYVFSTYRPPNGNFDAFHVAMDGMLERVGINKSIAIAGDFNVNFELENHNSVTFEDVLTSNGFVKTNTDPTRSNSCLDNIFINFCKTSFVSKLMEPHLSDHKAQLVSVNLSLSKINQTINKICRPLTQAGLRTFYDLVEGLSFDFVNSSDCDVDEKFNLFVNTLKYCLECAFPIKTYIVRSDQGKNISWFNDNLKQMRDRLQFLHELKVQYNCEPLIQNYKDFKKVYKKAIRDAKITANDKLIKSSSNHISAMWRVIKKNTGSSTKSNQENDISADEFNTYFSNIAKQLVSKIPKTDRNPTENLHSLNQINLNFKFREVSFSEIRNILDNLKNKNSRDIFGLSIKLIKSIKNLIIVPLTKLLNVCLRQSVFPNILKKALVIPIYKNGDKNDPSNYRPISLLPILSKVLEKVMAVQIVEFFEGTNCFYERQYGFRKGKSTTMAILNLINQIIRAFERKEYCAVLFCDLSKAFDCVSHELLIQKLKFYNFEDTSIQLIHSYLGQRVQTVRLGGVESTEACIDIGVPQGSILGPILFLIYINDLPMEGAMAIFTLFADDTTLSTSAPNMDEAVGGLGDARSGAETWFSASGLLLNRDKTKIAVFSLRDINIENNPDSVNFLGVHLDSKLLWDYQISSLAKSLSSSLFALKNLSECVSPSVLRNAYFALFHSRMTYAILAWGHAAGSSRIFGLQRKALRVLMGLGYREDCRPAFKSIKVLTLPSVYILENLLHVQANLDLFKTHSDLHDYETRQRDHFVPVYRRLERCRDGPGCLAVKLYNKVPNVIKDLPKNCFKSKMKLTLLENAFYSVKEFLNFNFSQ